ncbi:MAG: adenylosuccinate lyase [Planctomycetales bacterium]|nr:adenylosuccinate lyase [Planctomycetales bacterium]
MSHEEAKLSHDQYQNPLLTRYASKEMSGLWSPQRIHSTWRRLWVALAEAEHELGLKQITPLEIMELASAVDDIDFVAANRYERELRHDVMAHVHAYGDRCPLARGIIHLGATSCYVTDNTDLILFRESLKLIRTRLVAAIDKLAAFATEYRALPCLGYTHLQPAQPTTVGKRATLWCYDLVLDLEELEHRLATLRFRGAKGTTGTQASFLQLFDGDHAKCEALDRLVAKKMGFDDVFAVTGQTYTRKIDAQVLGVLSGVAQSAHKMGTDLRLLQNFKEIEEPFEDKQIGSSAMAYKRNPMRSERMCGLARFAMSLADSGEQTAAVQWMERTLDDSANRRLTLPQTFLAIDAVLILYRNIVDGLVVYPQVIARRLQAELPFMATENILMAAVAAGGDRQDLHERIRIHSQAAARRVKEDGADNDLLERLSTDPAFSSVNLTRVLDASQFVGRAPEQVDAFVKNIIDPIRRQHADTLSRQAEQVRV